MSAGRVDDGTARATAGEDDVGATGPGTCSRGAPDSIARDAPGRDAGGFGRASVTGPVEGAGWRDDDAGGATDGGGAVAVRGGVLGDAVRGGVLGDAALGWSLLGAGALALGVGALALGVPGSGRFGDASVTGAAGLDGDGRRADAAAPRGAAGLGDGGGARIATTTENPTNPTATAAMPYMSSFRGDRPGRVERRG